jgi:DNA invertase Pin-like site-specific DNA recombinase
MTRAYSYSRFSTAEQAKGDSTRRQTEAAQRYAREHKLELDDKLTISDPGLSAFRGRNLEVGALGAFLKAAQDGVIEEGAFLLVENLDRISRETARVAMRTLEAICDAGVTLVTLSDGQRYTKERLDNDPLALMIPLISFIRSNEESRVKSQRLSAAWSNKRANVSNGKPLTARAPGWLKLQGDKFIVIPERAVVVKRIFADTLDGVGQHTIAARLNKKGTPIFGRGKRWHRSYVAKILDNPAVTGVMTPHRVIFTGRKKTRQPLDPIEGYFPVVVDAQTFARVQAMKHAPSGRKDTEVQNVLASLATCSECGSTMTRENKGSRGRPKLVCVRTHGPCSAPRVDYEEVERCLVDRRVQLARTAPPASDAGRDVQREVASAEANLSNLEDRMEEIMRSIERRPSDALGRRLAKLEGEHKTAKDGLEELKRRQSILDGFAIQKRLDELKDSLGSTPLNRAHVNTMLRLLASEVVIHWRDGRLVFVWQHSGESALQYAWPVDPGV